MPTPNGTILMTANTVVNPTSSASQLTGFSTTRPYSSYDDGDQSVQPDPANNRILIHKPGIYEVTFSAHVYADGDYPTEFDIYLNGAALSPNTTNPNISGQANFQASEIRQISITGIIQSVAASGSTQDAVSVYMTSLQYTPAVTQQLTIVDGTLKVKRLS